MAFYDHELYNHFLRLQQVVGDVNALWDAEHGVTDRAHLQLLENLVRMTTTSVRGTYHRHRNGWYILGITERGDSIIRP